MMKGHATAGHLTGFHHPVFHLDDIARLDVPALHVGGSNEEVVPAPADGRGTVGGAHEPLRAGAAYNGADFRADGPLVGRILHVHEGPQVGVDGLLVPQNLFLGKEFRLAQCLGVQDGTGAELQGLKPLVSIGDILAHQDHAVVLHDDGLVVRVLLELVRNLLAQQLTARQGIGGETHGTANAAGLRDDAGVGNLVDDAEGNQSRGMGVDHRVHFRADLVQRPVERILGRRPVGADDGAVRFHANNVGGGKGTLVDTGRGNPNVPVVVHDGHVTTRGGGHSAAIDAPDDDGDLLCGMHEFYIQLFH